MAWNTSSALSYLCSSITRWWCCCGDGSSHQWDQLDFQLPLTRGKWWWVFPQRPPLVAEPSPCGVYHSHSPAFSDPAHSRIQPPLLANRHTQIKTLTSKTGVKVGKTISIYLCLTCVNVFARVNMFMQRFFQPLRLLVNWKLTQRLGINMWHLP